MIRLKYMAALLLWSHFIFCQSKIVQTVYLVGDVGESTKMVIDSIRANADKSGIDYTVLFLGDNIYPRGLKSDTSNFDILAN
ncbi:MAG: hypothetical protein O7F74_00280, partial [Bacteroidetes bacterium]|nr:hypothetical protein [Bacteroidota bacterium]